MGDLLNVRPDVASAIARGEPVVALESTVIAHGLPRPDNLELALELEALLREEGAVPATIGVIAGVARVGLEAPDIALLAQADGIPKLSARDLPAAAAKKSHGATTVAATAHLAARAGIRVMATGGLGGVHRDARESWDVSADLWTLRDTPVAVVASGVKSMLDVPATLEFLESLGVPVAGFRTQRFPGFYLTDSGCHLEWSVDSAAEAAAVIRAMAAFGMTNSGLVIANPVPPSGQLDPTLHDRALAGGLKALRRQGIRGKAVTPFLLEHFRRATGGASLEVNKTLLRNNARLAARVAVALAEGGGGPGPTGAAAAGGPG